MPEENLQQDSISFTGIKNFVKATLRSFFGFFAFLELTFIRNKWFLLFGFIVGLVLGYVYYLTKTSYYRVSMVVQHNELTKKTYAEMLNQLDKLVSRAENDNALASELNIPKDLATCIISIDGRNMNDALLSSDTSTRVGQPFKILVDLTKIEQLDTLQPALIAYLNNRPYLQRKREEQTKLYTARIAYIDTELQKLDSLKSEYTRFLSSSKISATVYNNAFNPADIYQQSIDLVATKENLLRWISIDRDAVTVLDGFKPVHARRSMPLLLILIASGILCMLIAYIIGFIGELRRAVAE